MVNSSVPQLILVLALMVAAVTASAQVVYRWVDENGVLHIADEKPEGVEAEVISVPRGTSQQTVPAPPEPEPVPLIQQPSADATTAAGETSQILQRAPSEMTLDELDERCETARELRIAPLREAEIERCRIEQRRGDPEWCERFYADFGGGGRTVSGGFRPRMFADLPECVQADEERRRRRLR